MPGSEKDVITQLEPELFKKVTGLDVHDFEMLCTIGEKNFFFADAFVKGFLKTENDYDQNK